MAYNCHREARNACRVPWVERHLAQPLDNDSRRDQADTTTEGDMRQWRKLGKHVVAVGEEYHEEQRHQDYWRLSFESAEAWLGKTRQVDNGDTDMVER